jgi:CheY-like chemotaxis protein
MAADLREIRKAAERSAEVTRQLLSFARRQTAAPRQLDPNEVVSGMLQMIRRLVGEDIDIVWRPGASVGAVFMDPTQLHQVLVNLCVNARDAITGAGRITVETSSCALDERQRAGRAGRSGAVPGDFVMLAVSDDGCGMDPATVRRLFEPFFTTKELGRGTGLGLSTVDGIVRQNGGHLEVESEPGKGTSIRIYLPRCERAAAPAAVSESRSPRQGGETVLLVEDEPSVLALCARMLRGLGYRVLAASSPERALGLARQHEGRIHLLLSDVVMPQMNGRELARRLVAALPDLRCLFMSGYTAHVIAPQGFLGEGARFLQKPFSREELAAMVRAAIDD